MSIQTDKKELLLSYSEEQLGKYMATNLREVLTYVPERVPPTSLAPLAEKHPRTFLLGNADLLHSLGEDIFNKAVVKQPTAALVGALKYLDANQVKYCMEQAPSSIFAVLAQHDATMETLPDFLIDLHVFWYCVQSAPEQAVINLSAVLAALNTDVARASNDTPPNGYTMWTIMDTQENPYSLPRVTMLDEVVIYAASNPVASTARIILNSVDEGLLSSGQVQVLQQRVDGASY